MAWKQSVREILSNAKTVLYRKPKDELKRLKRWGPRAYFRCEAWKREMEAAVQKLPILSWRSSDTAVELWFLTGKMFWYQTAFCAWTFARHTEREVILNLVDDGTLTPQNEEGLRRLFPSGQTVRKENILARIDDLLPVSRFPMLRQRWLDYVNIRKLTDIHLGSTGWKLVLDSDMLFFRRPDALLDWIDSTANGQLPTVNCLVMTDCVESYGYSRELMEEICGTKIPPKLNVGICGLKSEDLDWEELDYWCKTLVEREGGCYYLEQALIAMLAARQGAQVLSEKDYITFPNEEQVQGRCGVLQHYVADSKPWYFSAGWKCALENNR